MKSIYLKAPFLKKLKLRESKYCVQVYGDYQKYDKVMVCDAQQKLEAEVAAIKEYTLSKVPFFVLDDLGYRSRREFEGFIKGTHPGKDISEVYVLELVI